MSLATRILVKPSPIQRMVRQLIGRLGVGSYTFRSSIFSVLRPNYGYLVFQSAKLAARLGQPKVSVVEFGVAGGSGLLALEYHAKEVEKLFPFEIEVYGFDTGTGLPQTEDYRDLLYHWQPGFYKMDVAALKARLERAKLILGNVGETAGSFFREYKPAPIGAVSFDLDLYTSTSMALRLFDADPSQFLPRVFCYFDDVIGQEDELYGDFTGERLAINEFNDLHAMAKLSPIRYLRISPGAPQWHHQMWSLHLFEHPLYSKYIGEESKQLPL